MKRYLIILLMIGLSVFAFSPFVPAQKPSPAPGVSELIQQLGDKDTAVRGKARVALSRMGERAAPEILKAVSSAPPDQAYDMILILDHLNYRKAAVQMEKIWQTSKSPKVRAAAAMFLCSSGRDYDKYQDYLVSQAKEGQDEDRLTAMQVMGYIGDGRVVAPLQEIFYDVNQPDKVRQAAIWDLGHTPVPESARALVEMVNSSKVDWFYKEIVIASIRRLSADKEMAPLITRLLEKSLRLPATAASPPPASKGEKK